MPTTATAHDLEALADRLSACADTLHRRLLRALQRSPGTAPPDAIDQGTAQALFDHEVALRQRANGLYLEAAVLAARGLDGQQQTLLELATQAQDQISQINRLRDLISLLSDLLSLGAAIAAGKPEHLGPPVEKLRRHLADLHAGEPPSVQS